MDNGEFFIVNYPLSIEEHPEFVAYTEEIHAIFERWRDAHRPRLLALSTEDRPKALIETLSEALLDAFAPARLIDRYDVYQHLMTYWTETMQDDVYMITQAGWLGANKLRLLKGRSKESEDLKIGKLKYKADLIPPDLIIARYFPTEQAEIAALEAEKEALVQEREALEEEHGGDEGLLEESKSDAGNVTKGAAQARFREIEDDPEYADEREVLAAYLELRRRETKAGRAIREAQKTLDKKVVEKYKALTEAEVKSLVVDDKWLAALADDVQAELDQVSQALTGRIQELAERYAAPLAEIVSEVEGLSTKVAGHLERMGFSSNG